MKRSLLALALAVVPFAQPAALAADTATLTTSGGAPAFEKKVEGPSYKFNALLQAWTVSDNSTSSTNSLNFRLRRAELKLSGNVVSQMRYFVMADPAKGIAVPTKENPFADNRVLQDLGIAVMVAPGLEVVAGQFKILTTAEGLSSSAELLFPERSLTARSYGDRREPGLMISYAGSGYKLGAMASNGHGSNADASTTTKDLSLRADINILKDLSAGVFAQLGDLQYNKKGAWGLNARYGATRDLTFGAEFDAGRLAGINSYGMVLDVGYMITPDLQPVLRHEIFNPDSSKSVFAQQSTIGVNYLLFKHQAKLQAAVSFLTNMAGNNGSPKAAYGVNGPSATAVFQAAI